MDNINERFITILIGPTGKSLLAGLISRDQDTLYLKGFNARQIHKERNTHPGIKNVIIDECPISKLESCVYEFLNRTLLYGKFYIPLSQVIICCDVPKDDNQLVSIMNQGSIIRRCNVIELNHIK